MNPDDFDRVAKLLVDDGQAQSFSEAERILAGYRLQIVITEQVAALPSWQAAALTVVNAGGRAVHGTVTVKLDADPVCVVPLVQGQSLSEALSRYGARLIDDLEPGVPTIVLGDASAPAGIAPTVYAAAGTWTAAVAPTPAALDPARASVPAAVMAGAIAVSECFQWLRGNPVAADRQAGVSLWSPAADWQSPEAEGPQITRLPASAWLLGLGHLGQGYAWLLGLLPYPRTGERPLVLQDDDRLSNANRATSMLYTNEQVGTRKARLLSSAFEDLGWDTRLIEHRYLGGRMTAPAGPSILLAGVDNRQTRALLDESEMPVVIDAGLGAGPDGYLAIAVRTLPASRPSSEIFAENGRRAGGARRPPARAYRELERDSGDRCGVEQLAGRTVATAFVGVTAACWAIGGLLRELHGGQRYELIDYTLRDPGTVRAILLPHSRPPRVSTVAVSQGP